MVSGDFTISVAIFIATLILVLPLWGYVESQVMNSEQRRDMESSLLIVSDILTKTSGLPEDWNSSSVVSIGLSEKEGILNTTKFLNLMDTDYYEAKDLLGINEYELYITLKDINGYNLTSGVCNSPVAYFSADDEKVKELISNSGLVWDYYYGGDSPDQGDSRFFYASTKADAFNAMLSNRSIYKVIVVEEAGLSEDEINIEELKSFLDLGGILILEGNATLIKDGFGMHAEKGSGREGTVKESGFVLAETGKDVDFNRADWAFYQASGDTTLQTLVEDRNDGKAVIGYWDYGFGRIYYVSDINATVDSEPLELNIAGERLEFGIPASGNLVAKTQRIVLLKKDRNNIADMNVILWK